MSCCEEYWELISAALDGPLSPEERRRLDAHLEQCPQCRELAQELGAVHKALSELPSIAPPEGLSQQIMDGLDARPQLTPLTSRPSIHWQRWLASAAVLAVIVTAAWGLRPRGDQKSADSMDVGAAFQSSGFLQPASSGGGETPEDRAAVLEQEESREKSTMQDRAILPSSAPELAENAAGDTKDGAPSFAAAAYNASSPPADGALTPRQALDLTVEYLFAYVDPDGLERTYGGEDAAPSCRVTHPSGAEGDVVYAGEDEEAYYFTLRDSEFPRYRVDREDRSVSVSTGEEN